mgnify:CR=1 FL=1
MNEENVYNDIPARHKEHVGFPINYCHLSLEQKFFVDSIFCAKIETRTDTVLYEIENIKDDLESALELTNNTISELKGKDK